MATNDASSEPALPVRPGTGVSHSAALARLRRLISGGRGGKALDTRLSRAAPMGAALAISLGAVIVLATSPALFIADHWPDMFIALDAALHWAHGHRPHEDFHTPLGAAYIALMGVAGWIASLGPHTLIWANVIVGLLTALTMALVSFRRLGISMAAVCTLYWPLFALSPRRIAGGAEHLSWAGAYNKWGFALVAVLWLAAALPPRRAGPRLELVEAAALGAVLCFLFYIKLTYFAAGLAPFLFRALFLERGQARRLQLIPVFFGTGMIVFAALAGGVSLPGYARDILMAANASANIAIPHLSMDLQVNMALFGASLTAYYLHHRAFENADRGTAVLAGRQRSMFLALLILALAVNNQNTSLAIPLLALLPLVLAARSGHGECQLPPAARALMLLVPAGCFLWWSAIELRAVAHHHFAAASAGGTAFCSQADIPLCRVRVTDTDPEKPQYRAVWAQTQPVYEELYAALDPLVTSQSRIFQLGFANMLNARYGLEPARGGLLFWHYRRNFDETSRPADSSIFADVTLAIVPRRPVPNSIDESYTRIFGPYVRENFELAAQTPHWQIYQRK